MLNALSDAVNTFSDAPAKLAYMLDWKKFMADARRRAGFRSQSEAARAIGCERGTVGMWEAPSSAVKMVSSEYLMATAVAYKVRPEVLTRESDDDGYPWRPEDDSPVSRDTRRDLRILAAAIENLGVDSVSDEELIAEYERIKALTIADISGRSGGKNDGAKSRGNHRTGKHSAGARRRKAR